MSLFPRWTEFESPLIRLLDDYASLANDQTPARSQPQKIKTFSPKFDVKETEKAYELHGELPGIEQKNVNIEWTDGNTLTISGRVEHRSERKDSVTGEGTNGHQPTVEDAEDESDLPQTAVTKVDDTQKQVSKPSEQGVRYWVTERAVGEFHRTFSFPTRVDQEGVKASLKNGVLSISVPKAAAPKSRKISIE
ncbi:HSP20-like chaperone [Eremomyces bilateralis CBS 781.70]|uniref:HSP20-like chaperone n=1 Tax=Eremomyces bilateralis CBS 781.70 TaxID=1392243 RepID=A0A6G1GD14_9PEZI|nr:HSP20-like chaperone [Eremomyces bilateralis CBS 781.70]KAF1815913.1 HSP20-like chaperone [Eremomyces bilateralis CBS 781.70]